MHKTKSDFLQEIVEAYRKAGEPWPATARRLAAWAVREGHWKPHAKNLIGQCAAEIAAAMRQEYFTDPQGRRVRKKHAYRATTEMADGTEEQMYFWIDMTDAPHDQVELAFLFQRKLIVGDCKQLKTDVDSYNENNPHGYYVEVSFTFVDDMAEAEQPTTYPGL